MLRRTGFVFAVLLACLRAEAQYVQFSQYNFAVQRINPAMVAASDYASLSFLYRNQSTGGDFNLSSSMLSASYPLLHGRSGRRWSGIGMTLMDDRSGTAGLFTIQEASLSYAANVYLSKWQTLSLGLKGLYQQQKVNPSGLYTGRQYIPDRGFDESMFSGENFGELQVNYFTMSLGLYWQQLNRNNNRVAYWSISFFDFNNPQNGFIDGNSQLHTTSVAAAGLRVVNQGALSIMPEVLYTRSNTNNVFNIGAITSYELNASSSEFNGRVDLITKYVIGRSAIAGIQFHKENFSFGFSYDFPLFTKNPGNLGAIEFGVELRGLVDPRARKRALARKKAAGTKANLSIGIPRQEPSTTQSVKSETINTPAVTKPSLKEDLRQKQDSVLALAQAGRISHEALVIERVTLHFNFEFNSSELDDASANYLDELADALADNPQLSIKLVGHTDNIGSARFNERLSLQRANAIKARLVQQGIQANRIITEGKGLTEPLNNNETEEDRAKNRRVELTIIYN